MRFPSCEIAGTARIFYKGYKKTQSGHTTYHAIYEQAPNKWAGNGPIMASGVTMWGMMNEVPRYN